jgi:transposase
MRRIRDCLRLNFENKFSQVQISKMLQISRSTVQEYISRLTIASTSYEDTKLLTDEALENVLYNKAQHVFTDSSNDKELNYSYIHAELAKKGVTLRLLWEEYKSSCPNGYQYSQFCYYFKQWRKTLKVYMHQQHIAGERMYVDYSGKKPSIVNRFTGVITEVELFVMCWGYSQYIYAEAHENQKRENWAMGHVRAFQFFGCVGQLIVPDNLKSAVTKAHIYDPDVNQSYESLASHYHVGVLPARSNHPKDKAKVENSVRLVQRWILARLRNQTFHSMAELNSAIWRLLDDLNKRKMKKLNKSRYDLFVEVDKPNAQALPQTPYTYIEWHPAKVNLDYHIEINRRYYSVPWHYCGQTVSACIENNIVSIYCNNNRIAMHDVKEKEYSYSTDSNHMPPNHKAHYDWNIERVYSNARKVGMNTETLIKKIISMRSFPQQGLRPSMGILALGTRYGNDRLEAAAEIALNYNLYKTQQIKGILQNGKDLHVEESEMTVENTTQIRGQDYYSQIN